MLVAMLSIALFGRSRISSSILPDVFLVVGYSSLLVIQQFFIPGGTFNFGLNFFVATVAAFMPCWMIRTTERYCPHITKPIQSGIMVLFWVAFLSIATSFLFGIGERYANGGILGARAFGLLGDSFSPVNVFLVLFFIFNRQFTFAAMVVVLMLMTGGKSALLMLIISLMLHIFFVSRSVVAKIFLAVGMLILALFQFEMVDILNSVQNFQFSFNNRLFSIEVGLNYFRENPWFGIGINQALHRIGDDVDALARQLGETQYFPVYQIHNAYIRSLAETGAIGFMCLAGLVLFWVSKSVGAIRVARGVPRSVERSITLASSYWIISFTLAYQSTGWFLSGHPQLAWLLIFFTFSTLFSAQLKMTRTVTQWSQDTTGLEEQAGKKERCPKLTQAQVRGPFA